MLSRLFRRADAAPASPAVPPERFNLFARADTRFAIPDWERIDAALAPRLAHEDPDALWTRVARHWLETLQESLGGSFTVTESDHFLLLSPGSARECQLLREFADKTRKRILKLLDGIARDEGHGKSCILVFADDDQYYEYVANYYPDEGEFAFSGGMYINAGYGHFVCVQSDLHAIEPVIAHELTHLHLSHLDLPAWLNEGLAVNTELLLCPPRSAEHTPAEWQALHDGFWTAETIQEFWSGKSFLRPDEGNKLSYDLARKLVTLLSGDRPRFTAFANAATLADGGAGAARAHLGAELGDAVAHLLHDGFDWRPDPAAWQGRAERGGFTMGAA